MIKPQEHIKSEKRYKKSRSSERLDFLWLGYLDSNQGNARFRVWCLTAWLYPNFGNTDILIKNHAFVNNKFHYFKETFEKVWKCIKNSLPMPFLYYIISMLIERVTIHI